MSSRVLPARPNIDQYRKQAKELLTACKSGDSQAVDRLRKYSSKTTIGLADAQFAIAREHGFDNWGAFATAVETARALAAVESVTDPLTAFIEAAIAPREAHGSGTLDEANLILSRHPSIQADSIHVAAILADHERVRAFLARDPAGARSRGGPRGWDPLTHLCFSRYLRLDKSRSEAFVRTARVLLDGGASANTGWYETIDQPHHPRQVIESAIYGAAGIAQHAALTRLLLERGADPNDEETPYHVPETRDNTVMRILLESGKLNARSLSWLLVRKIDWHDHAGVMLVLDHRPPESETAPFGRDALAHAVRRDNGIETIEALLDAGLDPSAAGEREPRTATTLAAERGRGDILLLLKARAIPLDLTGVDALIAACAMDDREDISKLMARDPALRETLAERGGTLLAEFSGVGNVWGVRNLIDCGVSPGAIYREGDPYFDIASNSTALHVAAWRGNTDVVKELVARGTPIDAVDGKGRTALMLAVKACVDSYWMADRTPDSVRILLDAGASPAGIAIPCGYDEVDALLTSRD
jgi:hypothetical protein